MAVDFTPTLEEYSGQGKFRYWVQMVLPTIYDDSLSYMELLNKVVYVINLAIEDVNTVEENVAALLTAFEQLQQYTNDYFDNLDVQQEINNKLDQMVEDGTLSTVIDPLVASSTSQWLEEHITPTTPAIDNTLTVSGAAADAKAAGDAIFFNSAVINELKLKGIGNLLPKFQTKNFSVRGLSYDLNDDGSVTVTGTTTGSALYNLYTNVSKLPYGIENGKTYKFSYSSTVVDFHVGCYKNNTSTIIWLSTNNRSDGEFTVPDDATGLIIRIAVAGTGTEVNETVHPYIYYTKIEDTITENLIQLNQNRILGNTNLIPPILPQQVTIMGLTYTHDEEGSIHVEGTTTGSSIRILFNDENNFPLGVNPGESYRFTYNSDNIDFHIGCYQNNNLVWISSYNKTDGEFTVPDDATGLQLRLGVAGANVEVNETVHPYILGYETDTNYVKSYYKNELETTVQTILTKATEPALVMALCTDIHYQSEISESVVLKWDSVTDMCNNMKALKERVKIDRLICLGDIVDSRADTSVTKNKINYVMQQLHSVGLPFDFCAGNHDDNRYILEGQERFDPEELYSYMYSYVDNNRTSDAGYHNLNYYRDFDDLKIRLISILESYIMDDDNWHYGYSDETLQFFTSSLSSTPSDYGVIVITHKGFVKNNNWGLNDHGNQANMRTAITNFINGGGKYICTLYGHSHVDFSNNTPWLEIGFGSAKVENFTPTDQWPAGSIAPQRTAKTASEDLWTIVIIKPQSKTIECVRFGAGNDRAFTYN